MMDRPIKIVICVVATVATLVFSLSRNALGEDSRNIQDAIAQLNSQDRESARAAIAIGSKAIVPLVEVAQREPDNAEVAIFGLSQILRNTKDARDSAEAKPGTPVPPHPLDDQAARAAMVGIIPLLIETLVGKPDEKSLATVAFNAESVLLELAPRSPEVVEPLAEALDRVPKQFERTVLPILVKAGEDGLKRAQAAADAGGPRAKELAERVRICLLPPDQAAAAVLAAPANQRDQLVKDIDACAADPVPTLIALSSDRSLRVERYLKKRGTTAQKTVRGSLDQQQDSASRAASLEVLNGPQLAGLEPSLLEWYADEVMRPAVVKAMNKTLKTSTPLIIDQLSSSDPTVRARALGMLERLANGLVQQPEILNTAKEKLVRQLSDPKIELQASALAGLAAMESTGAPVRGPETLAALQAADDGTLAKWGESLADMHGIEQPESGRKQGLTQYSPTGVFNIFANRDVKLEGVDDAIRWKAEQVVIHYESAIAKRQIDLDRTKPTSVDPNVIAAKLAEVKPGMDPQAMFKAIGDAGIAPAVSDASVTLLANPHHLVRRAAVESTLRCLTLNKDPLAIMDLLVAMSETDTCPLVRQQIVGGWSHKTLPWSIIRADALSPDEATRARAARLLAQCWQLHPPYRADEDLFRLADDKSPKVAEAAAIGLARDIRQETGVAESANLAKAERIARLLDSPHPQVRLHLLDAVPVLPMHGVVGLDQHADANVQIAAKLGMEQFPDGKNSPNPQRRVLFDAAANALTNHPSRFVRSLAARSLVQPDASDPTRITRGVPLVEAAIRGKSLDAAADAARGLRRVYSSGSPHRRIFTINYTSRDAAIARETHLSKAPKDPIRFLVIERIFTASMDIGDPAKRIDAVEQMSFLTLRDLSDRWDRFEPLLDDLDPQVRAAAIKVAGDIYLPAAREAARGTPTAPGQ